jgi:hypothetical protein
MSVLPGRSSRYRTVAGMTAAAPDAGTPVVPELRPLPTVTGTYRHLVQAGERLDLLAATYYGRATDWWRICDGNPDFLLPLALVASDPTITTVVPLTPATGAPPWDRLIRALSALPGVRAVQIEDDVEQRPRRLSVGGRTVVLVEEVPVRALRVTHIAAEVSVDAIAAAVLEIVAIGPVAELTEVGREIVVPASPVGGEGL